MFDRNSIVLNTYQHSAIQQRAQACVVLRPCTHISPSPENGGGEDEVAVLSCLVEFVIVRVFDHQGAACGFFIVV